MAALEHFGVPDPATRVDAYADRKQEMVVELIEAGKFSAYPDALRFLLAVKDAGIAVAAASSSKNAGLFLRQIRLDEFAAQEDLEYAWLEDGLTLLDAFDVDISGRHFERGKPHPGDLPDRGAGARRGADAAFVVEDAVSGVQAAKAGAFAAFGVARHDDEAHPRGGRRRHRRRLAGRHRPRRPGGATARPARRDCATAAAALVAAIRGDRAVFVTMTGPRASPCAHPQATQGLFLSGKAAQPWQAHAST